MKKFRVHGTVVVCVSMEVEAEDAGGALETADDTFGTVTGYAGNGGWDKLIGVSGSNESIECNDYPTWTDAEEIE